MPAIDPPRRELSSWKEVASCLRVSVRTAQKWEIEKGLPVHRMPGSAGRVSADAAELERWKERMGQRPPWWARANVRVYYAVLLPVLLAGTILHDVWSHHRKGARVPSSYRIEWNELVVLDAARTEMWRRTFPEPVAPGRDLARHAIQPPVAIQDLNQDGFKEVLLVQNAADFGQDVVFCFSHDGRQLWRFDPLAVPGSGTDLQNTVTNVVPARYVAAESGMRPNSPTLFVVTCSVPAHKGRLYSLDEKGRSRELFRHEGHLDRVVLDDVDLDEIGEIVIGGFDAERHQANLHLLHPPAPGNRSAEIEAEVFFPRTALNRELAEENRVYRLTARKGFLQVSTLEWLAEDRYEVCYTLNSQLRAQVWLCDPYPLLRRRLLMDRKLPLGSEANEIAELGRSVEVIRRRPL